MASADAETPEQLMSMTPDWSPARVPGTVAESLMALGTPIDRLPDLDSMTWWYRTSFTMGDVEHHPGSEGVVFRAEGLATLADVWFNGTLVASSNNMFVPVEAQLRELMRDNELFVRFAPLIQSWPRRPRARWPAAIVERRDLRWIRTTLIGRTPGFSHPAMPVGPWRDVRLEISRIPTVLEHTIDVSVDGDCGKIIATALVRSADRPYGDMSCDGVDVKCDQPTRTSEDLWSIRGELSLDNIDRWWPHTHGDAATYDVEFRVGTAEFDLDTIRKRVGFRTVELVDDDFKFIVNGTPIFCRGSCWMPPDPVSLNDDIGVLRDVLIVARDAGFNMIRLTGGTLYASETFLSVCDELGIMVWQDFMFGPLDYPFDDPNFHESVGPEIDHFLHRIRGHPSIAALCGNSEFEQRRAMIGLADSARADTYFTEELADLCANLAPSVPYIPSSPSGGDLPFMPNAGCTHYYGVGAYMRCLVDARSSGVRFASECLAFSNIPNDDGVDDALGVTRSPTGPTWKQRVPRDLGAGWDFEDVRDHYFADVFDDDPIALRMQDPWRYLELSRVVTGEIMARTFALWRDPRSSCNGALVWFHRDLWQGAGWGLVDHEGRPKAALEILKRVLQPVSASLIDDGMNGLMLSLVNDTTENLRCEVSVKVGTFAGAVLIDQSVEVEVPARDAAGLSLNQVLGEFRDLNYAYRFGPLHHDLVNATVRVGERTLECWHFPVALPSRPTDELNMSLALEADSDGARVLHISTDRFAQYVHVTGAEVPDNYFHVAPWRPAKIQVEGSATKFMVKALNSRAIARIDANVAVSDDHTPSARSMLTLDANGKGLH